MHKAMHRAMHRAMHKAMHKEVQPFRVLCVLGSVYEGVSIRRMLRFACNGRETL